jgi:hypothetical protein
VTLVARADSAAGALRRGSDGALYGVTKYGGPNAVGIVVESLSVPPGANRGRARDLQQSWPGDVGERGNALASPLP